MPRKPVHPQNDEPKRPTLQRPRAEVEGQIQVQIEKGKELLGRAISNSAQLEEAQAEEGKWSAFNTELLRRIVDTDELRRDYEFAHAYGYTYLSHSRVPFPAQVKNFQSGVQKLVLHLEEILPRLELIPGATKDTLSTVDVTHEGVFFAGQPFDALQRITKILSQAQKDITIIDGYVSEAVLDILTSKTSGVTVKILTTTNSDTRSFRNAAAVFNNQYKGLSIRTSAAFHDRFVIIDDSDFFHFGASIKDLGKRGFMFSRIEEPAVIQTLRAELQQEWAKAPPIV